MVHCVVEQAGVGRRRVIQTDWYMYLRRVSAAWHARPEDHGDWNMKRNRETDRRIFYRLWDEWKWRRGKRDVLLLQIQVEMRRNKKKSRQSGCTAVVCHVLPSVRSCRLQLVWKLNQTQPTKINLDVSVSIRVLATSHHYRGKNRKKN